MIHGFNVSKYIHILQLFNLKNSAVSGLSGNEIEKHLVVSIGEHSYLALPKGGMTPDHVMILPISHYSSQLDIPEEVEKEMTRFKSALRKCFKKAGKAVIFFERNYK